MKLSVQLDEIVTDDYQTTVAEIIRDEINNVIRAAVKAELKAFKANIEAEVRTVSKDVIASLKKERVREIARRMAAEL